ncbi:biotin carboxylase N-terminal domain-containing protein [Psychromonas sp. 14N.309.X.WAT.B.A12]|uniref:ATP-binding protein n=1 Tax=unclassified Psychromonas TaxID=2614957 RepID=UPI0025B000C3|nr:biotin carboxylase N-terminal domain-containing protein [Psychromonas sp. 14N.309.X.WAT.B.A12]MDN2664164.1 ATP-grasp domain-containing protein [Psychromonas sp. 14N.309.X.WAT.B.A12]
MTGKPSSSQFEVNNIADPLFIHAEHIAKDFSLFPDNSLPSKTDGVEGLIESKRIKSNLATIKKLDVDAYIARTVTPAESNKRPGAKSIVEGFNGKIVTEQVNGAFYSAEMELDFGGYSRRVGFIAQERSSNNGAWMPEHHLAASKAIRKFADLSLPIVYLIDTPGADAGEEANSQNQAHTISQMITESANVDVPTIGIVVGVGYSGGAIPLATANILLSVRDGIFNTIQPKGLQSIARKYNLSWQECAQSVGVSPEELLTMGCIDGIVDYSPVDQDERQHNLQKAIVSGILSIEAKSVDFVRQYPELLEHYNRSLSRYLEPSSKLAAIENATEARLLAKNPTSHNNAFGTTYRYMRYLTLRSRIKAIQKNEYGRLSKLTVPEGDLKARIEADRKQIFLNWLENPDKLIYDDTLNKNWKSFLQKREDKSVERNVLTKLILGEPKANYDNARSTLMINLTWSLYNRWKTSAENNFHSLIKHLENEEKAPLTESWPDLADLNIIDAVSHVETRESFILHCRHMLVFNALYDNTMGNLASIAKEAMATKELSRESVSSLVRSSLKAALSKVSDDDYEQLKVTFNAWLQYFTEQSERGEILAKVEEWKSIGAPQMNSSLFVILTYLFEKLLPEYYNSREDESSYNGAINPVRIGRRKDFWNRLTMGYQDLLIQAVLRSEKNKKNNSHQAIIEKFFANFKESRADLMTANLLEFPGFRLSVEDALDKNIKPCGLITGTGDFTLQSGEVQRVGVAVSNLSFQAGAFDMASAEKFCALLVKCAKQHLPVIAFISSGGMQTKEGAAALFSMSVVNDRITRFIRDNDLPVVMFGYGDCTGGAQASFVTHPMAQTYYLSGTNMPFAGQMVVPAYLPSTSTLSNYLSRVPGAMDGLVINPFSDDLNSKLREIDENMPMPVATVEETIQRALSGFVPVCNLAEEDNFTKSDPRQLMHPVKKVLIHARGCTAVKLIRIAKQNNINVVLVASDPDMTSVPADMLGEGDKLVCLGGNTSDESYLNASSVLKVAEYEQVDALHPGIGFLSESPQFADLCISHNVNFVGPSMNSMLTMGNKSNAIKTAQANGVPVVPGSHGILSGAEQALDIANEMGYPVLLKAVNGGGGKGILVINKAEDMFAGFNQVSAEARSAFGNGDLYLEKYITSLRHIEVQLLRDKFGNTKVLGIRDCSVQRNNQKVVEESASTMLPEKLEQEALKHTAALANAVDYMGAGTVEFIYDLDADDIYFMEMNTRLQVEHPVTEATSCIDIVKAQYDIASGADISELTPKKEGYAIEVRVTAEKAGIDSDGVMQLLPHPGKVVECIIPEQDDVEVMSMIATGKEVSPYYDSLVAQFICHGKDRNDTVKKLLAFLDKVSIKGIATNIPLLQRILKDETFLNGNYDTTYLPKFMAKLDQQVMIDEMEASAASGLEGAAESIQVDGSNELKVIAQSAGIFYRASSPAEPDFVLEGDIVGIEQTLGLMEAMKMFSPVTLGSFNRKDAVLYDANTKFRIERIINTNGQQVSSGDLLYIITPL